VRAQLRPLRRELEELRQRQLVVHAQRAEPGAALRGEIVGDMRDERGLRSVPDAQEQRAPALRIELALEQLVEAFVADLREIRRVLGGRIEQALAVEVLDLRRALRVDLGDLGLVPVRDAEPIAQLVGDAARILAELA